MNYSPLIYAFQQENIAVTGRGVLGWFGCERQLVEVGAAWTRRRRSTGAS